MTVIAPHREQGSGEKRSNLQAVAAALGLELELVEAAT